MTIVTGQQQENIQWQFTGREQVHPGLQHNLSGMGLDDAHCSNPCREIFRSFSIIFADEQQQYVYMRQSNQGLFPSLGGKLYSDCFLLMHHKCLCYCFMTHITLRK